MTAGAETWMWSRQHYRIAELDDTYVLCKTGTYGKCMRNVFMSHVGWLPERMEEEEEGEVMERACGSGLIHSQCSHWVEPGYGESLSIILQRKQESHLLPAAHIKTLDGLKAEETMCYKMSNKSMFWARLSERFSGNVIPFEGPAVTETNCRQNMARTLFYLYLEVWGRFLGFRLNFQQQCVGLTDKRSHFGSRRDGGYHSCRLVTNDDPWRQNGLAINSGLAYGSVHYRTLKSYLTLGLSVQTVLFKF